VRTRLEGQRRQYDLRERAQALGFQHVVVIDEDQGRSGTGSVERPGFGRVLAAFVESTKAVVRYGQLTKNKLSYSWMPV
jgi:DNA invertase Pin-like site-specific DNA recombinase